MSLRGSAVRRRRFEPLEIRQMFAAPDVWQARGIGGGGALFSPSISPTDGSEVYISSDMSEIFHTTNQGATWDVVNFREIQGSHHSQVQFTSNPLVRYSLDYSTVDLADMVRPSKSVDGGATWTPLESDPTDGGAFTLRVDPNNPNNVVLSDYTRLYFSNNGGGSFTQKYVTDDTDLGLHLAGVFFDAAKIYVGTNEGLLVSTDGGTSFALVSISGIPSTQALVSFAGAKQNGITRLVGVTHTAADTYAGIGGADHGDYQGIYTLDYGQGNWLPKTNGITAGSHPFYVSMAGGDINTAYVAGGSDNGDPIVFKTSNGGGSWSNVFFTSGNQNIQTGWSGSGGDRDWSYGEFAEGFVVSPTNPNQAIITDLGFAHMTTDGGATWRVLNVAPADRNPAGANTPTGKSYHSSGLDNDTSWGVTWVDATHMVGSFSDIRGTISADGGNSWSLGYTGHTQNSMYRAVTHPVSGVVYAATGTVHDMYQSTYLTDARIDGGGGKVLFSTNKGAAWQTLHDFAHPVVWVATDPTNPNRLYASVVHSTQGGIYVSSNIQNGAASTWTRLAAPPRTEGHAFNILVLADGTLVASYSGRRNNNAFTASSGVFVSTNGGSSWTDRSDPGMRYWTKDIVVDPHDPAQNTWYVGVFSGYGGAPNGLGGLYKTTNRGVSWTRINSIDRVTSATISPTNPNQLYLTSEIDGLWISENINSAAPTFSPVTSYPFRQPERVFFNPYNAGEIWVTSFGNSLRVGTLTAPATVQGRAIFYNNSVFDGNNPAAGASDDAAIATDKAALLPGQLATLSNYTSYNHGINGVMVDLALPPGAAPTAADFGLRVGNDNQPAQWVVGPTPAVAIRPGAGANGSSRITLTWPDEAITNKWLEVTVKQTAATGLSAPDVFYFGNAVAESGNAPGNTTVDANDEIAARNNPKTFVSPATISDHHDFNRDGFVNAADQILARSNATGLNKLVLIAFPIGSALAAVKAEAVVAAGLASERTNIVIETTLHEVPSLQLPAEKRENTLGPAVRPVLGDHAALRYRLVDTALTTHEDWAPLDTGTIKAIGGLRQLRNSSGNLGVAPG